MSSGSEDSDELDTDFPGDCYLEEQVDEVLEQEGHDYSDKSDNLEDPGRGRGHKLIQQELQKTSVGQMLVLHLFLATAIRLFLMVYGLVHDQLFHVKYTDVDYSVFTDGAYYLARGRSPFFRHGYRYSPLLAFIVVPNVYLFNSFGKLVFIAADVLVGYLIYLLLEQVRHRHPQLIRITPSRSVTAALIWLYNPLPLVVSTRGSSDSIITLLVLLSLWLTLRQRPIMAGLVYGLVVHFKQYPVIYAPVIYCYLQNYANDQLKSATNQTKSTTNHYQANHQPFQAKEIKPFLPELLHRINPFSLERIGFFLASALSFIAATGYCYHRFGDQYIEEGWLYHFKRIDLQHNFSIYFYLYRFVEPKLMARLAFLPQLLLCVYYSWSVLFGHDNGDDRRTNSSVRLLWSLFAETFWFVHLNKVITSQYFLWYLALMPLAYPFLDRTQLTNKKSLIILTVWLLAQAQWLLPAYLFEFRKINWAIHWTGIASVIFLLINFYVFQQIANAFTVKMKAN